MKETLDHNSLLAKKTRVLLNYTKNIDVDAVDAEVNLEDPYIVFFGRLAIEKGLVPLAEAMKALPHVRLLIAGEGPMKECFKDLPNVTFLGFLSGMDLYKVVKGALFSVCPSVWHENCPFAVIESLKLRTPVLASRVGGIPELIDDGETGLLTEAGNVEALKEKIDYLWKERDLLSKMRQKLKETSYMDIDAYGNELLRIYDIK